MAEVITPNCPLCGRLMKVRKGSRGEFFGCPAFPRCKGNRPLVEYPQDIKLIPGSPQQEAIWDWLANGKESGLIEANAGTGKTFTIVNSIARLRGKNVAVFSFNNHIIKELNEKLKAEGITWARGHTFNSFGFKCVKNHPKLRDAELFQDKLQTLILELFPGDSQSLNVIRSATEKLVRLCKCYLDDGKDEESLGELVERFNVDFNGDDCTDDEMEDRVEKIYKAVPKVLDMCLNRRATMDFDDQVWWTVKMHLPVERFDIVFVDEAQDTNKMQQELIRMACPE